MIRFLEKRSRKPHQSSLLTWEIVMVREQRFSEWASDVYGCRFNIVFRLLRRSGKLLAFGIAGISSLRSDIEINVDLIHSI